MTVKSINESVDSTPRMVGERFQWDDMQGVCIVGVTSEGLVTISHSAMSPVELCYMTAVLQKFVHEMRIGSFVNAK